VPQRTAALALPCENRLDLEKEGPMIFRLFVVAATAVLVISPAALSSLV